MAELTNAAMSAVVFACEPQMLATGPPAAGCAMRRAIRTDSMSYAARLTPNELSMRAFAASTAFAGRSSKRRLRANCVSFRVVASSALLPLRRAAQLIRRERWVTIPPA